MVVSDTKLKLEPSQFGNQRHTSIRHYLVRLLHQTLTSVDRNSRGEVKLYCVYLSTGTKHTPASATHLVLSRLQITG